MPRGYKPHVKIETEFSRKAKEVLERAIGRSTLRVIFDIEQKATIMHSSFAVRQLPHAVFEHYKTMSQADNISAVSFYNENGLLPTIWVEREDHEDIWIYTLHVSHGQMPRQINRHYSRSQTANSITEVVFYQDDDNSPLVEVTRSEEVDMWRWLPIDDKSEDCCWKMTETNPSREGSIKDKWDLDTSKPEPCWYLYSSTKIEEEVEEEVEVVGSPS